MNCRRGDLAVIVAPYFDGALGYYVRVIRPAREFEHLDGAGYVQSFGAGPGWVVEGRIPAASGTVRSMAAIADACLRPIRDPGDDATDETLEWLPVPGKAVTA